MARWPTGTVSFLFTDIEGSTRLARENPETWEPARQRHNCILRSAIESNNGFVFKLIADSFCAAFHRPGEAVRAAMQAQRALQDEPWEKPVIRVRMGIHTGEAETDGKDYRGYLTLSLVQRVMSAGHGGQLLVTEATERLLQTEPPKDLAFLDLGEYRLKDTAGPMRLFQVTAPGLQAEFPALRALDVFPNNLPTSLTRFVGREKEIGEVSKALAEHRLVTLTGPGGAGKTRLAVQVGIAAVETARASGLFPDGVFFVDLAPLQPAEAMVPAIAAALRFSFYRGGDPCRQLLDFLREKSLLLILDNLEHLLSGAELLTQILNAAPGVKILATSRTRLSIPGEQIFHLGGMDFPVWETSDELSAYGAVRLFLDGARRVQRSFEPSLGDLQYVARICCLVEGMPLGILLAASWLEMLKPGEIAQEIEKSLDFLETQERGIPDRQRSMRAVFDYSWNLLTPAEQAVFMKASVFRGGFTREAAQAATGASLHDLMGLVDKSMLQRQPNGRYGIHELLRQYAADKLAQSPGDEQAARDLHSGVYAAFLHEREPLLHGKDQRIALSEIEAEIDNVQVGWQWALDHFEIARLADYLESMGELYGTRGWYQNGAKLFAEAEQSLTSMPESADDPTAQLLAGRLLWWQGVFREEFDTEENARRCLEAGAAAFRKLGAERELGYALSEYAALIANGATETAEAACQEALGIFRKLGDQRGTALALRSWAEVAFQRGELPLTKQRSQESVDILRELADQKQLVRSLAGLGYDCWILGEYQQAQRHHEEVLALSEELGDQGGISRALGTLAIDTYAVGDYARAWELMLADLAASRRTGSSSGVAITLGNLAEVSLAMGNYAEAAQLADESAALYARLTSRPNTWSLRIRGNAAVAMEELSKAQAYLCQALDEDIRCRDWGHSLLTLVGIAGLFAKQRKQERALELLALVMSHRAAWQKSRDDALPLLSRLEIEFPRDVALAAQERGRGLDLEATLAQVLNELRGPVSTGQARS